MDAVHCYITIEIICSAGWFIIHLSSAWPVPWCGTGCCFTPLRKQSSAVRDTAEGPCPARPPSSAPCAPCAQLPHVPLVRQRLPEADATTTLLLLDFLVAVH